jgi:hypothetical protein
VEPTSVVEFGIATALLVVVTLVATLLPARRAARTQPAVVLRDWSLYPIRPLTIPELPAEGLPGRPPIRPEVFGPDQCEWRATPVARTRALRRHP